MKILIIRILHGMFFICFFICKMEAQAVYVPGGIVGNSGNTHVGIGVSDPIGRLDVVDLDGDRAIFGHSAAVVNRFDLRLLDTPENPKTLHFWGGDGSNGYRMGQFHVNAVSIFLNTTNGISINGPIESNMGEGFRIFGDSNYFGTGNDGIIFEMRDINGLQGWTDGGFVWRGYSVTDSMTREWMVVRTPGVVGIGTKSPESMLDVNTGNFTKPAGSAAVRIVGDTNRERFAIESSTPVFQAGKFNGLATARTAVAAGDHLGYFQAGGFDGATQHFNQGRIVIVADENHSTTAHGTRIEFQTTPRGSTAPAIATRMTINGDGNVGIGTTSPSEKLSVNGRVRAKEVIVETTGWSDYVFAPDYDLPDLNEVEAHIREHGHLPGIPSAKEVAEEGVSVGEMQARLLAKIEELTLHVIEQQKVLSVQNAQLAEQAARIEQLESATHPTRVP